MMKKHVLKMAVSSLLALALIISPAYALIYIYHPSSVEYDVPLTTGKRGYISLEFDDGFHTQYDYAFPILQTYGIKASFMIPTAYINGNFPPWQGGAQCMTTSELQTLQNAGMEIGSHGVTHLALPSMTYSEIVTELQNSQQTLHSLGLSGNNFAYPNGEHSGLTDTLAQQYYHSATWAYVPPYAIYLPAPFSIQCDQGDYGTTNDLSRIKSMVDEAYNLNCWEIIAFHEILPNGGNGKANSMSITDFTAFLNYSINKGVTFMTVEEGMNYGQTSHQIVSENVAISGLYGSNPTVIHYSDADSSFPIVICANGIEATKNVGLNYYTDIAKHGYIVYCFDAVPPNGDNYQYVVNEKHDIEIILNWVYTNSPYGNRNNIVLLGASAGGNVASTFGADNRLKGILLEQPVSFGLIPVINIMPIYITTGQSDPYGCGLTVYEGMQTSKYYVEIRNQTHGYGIANLDGYGYGSAYTQVTEKYQFAWLDYITKNDMLAYTLLSSIIFTDYNISNYMTK